MPILDELARYYKEGIITISLVVIILHIIFSIRLVIKSRREGIDICISAFIPVYNLVLWIKYLLRKCKNCKKVELNEEIEL